MVKILTVCSAGLIRSVSMTDVLKVRCVDVDVIPVGIDANSKATLNMMYEWADHIILMMEEWRPRVPSAYRHKVKVCDVGPDVYGNSRHPELIKQDWDWVKAHASELGITQHNL